MQKLQPATIQSAALYRVPKMPSCLALISDDDARDVSIVHLQTTVSAEFNLRSARCKEWNRHNARLPVMRNSLRVLLVKFQQVDPLTHQIPQARHPDLTCEASDLALRIQAPYRFAFCRDLLPANGRDG
jgi:hypothetical protein